MPRAKPLPEGSPIEPVWYLRGLPYGEYRQSNHWRLIRQRYAQSVIDEYGWKKCELCGLERFEDLELEVRFNVHHITYEHLGYELYEDLALLCSPCHNLVHYPDSHAARHWLLACNQDWNHDLVERSAALRPVAQEVAA